MGALWWPFCSMPMTFSAWRTSSWTLPTCAPAAPSYAIWTLWQGTCASSLWRSATRTQSMLPSLAFILATRLKSKSAEVWDMPLSPSSTSTMKTMPCSTISSLAMRNFLTVARCQGQLPSPFGCLLKDFFLYHQLPASWRAAEEVRQPLLGTTGWAWVEIFSNSSFSLSSNKMQ